MNRGVIVLTQAEIDYILGFLSKENPAHAALISQLNLASQDKDADKNMQINVEQVELLMDNLGIPTEGEDSVVQGLRMKLQNSLSKMNA